MKASTGHTTKTSTSTSPERIYALPFKGGLIELRVSHTMPRKRVSSLTTSTPTKKKVFTQWCFDGGEHLAYTKATKLYVVAGVYPTNYKAIQLNSIQELKVREAVEDGVL